MEVEVQINLGPRHKLYQSENWVSMTHVYVEFYLNLKLQKRGNGLLQNNLTAVCTYLVYYLHVTCLVSETQAYGKISSLGQELGLLYWIS